MRFAILAQINTGVVRYLYGKTRIPQLEKLNTGISIKQKLSISVLVKVAIKISRSWV